MSDNVIHFLGEDDFLSAMDRENRIWREKYVTNGGFTARDGIRLNYYLAEKKNPKGIVVLLHGYCEFWGKYHEFAWYLWQAGYRVYFLEQRSHGHSEGKQPNPGIVPIDNFYTYTDDLKEFMDQIVLPYAADLPRFLLAHSMGGAVSALFLGTWPGYFTGAILSSPMLKMHADDLNPAMIAEMKLAMTIEHKEKDYFPGMHDFIRTPEYDTSESLSRARYDYAFKLRLAEPDYQTSGASYGWVVAGVEVRKLILDSADRITIPITLMQAEKDSLVDASGFDDFMEKVPQARKIFFKNSKHEIFNAGDEVRIRYFRDVLDQLESMIQQPGSSRSAIVHLTE